IDFHEAAGHLPQPAPRLNRTAHQQPPAVIANRQDSGTRARMQPEVRFAPARGGRERGHRLAASGAEAAPDVRMARLREGHATSTGRRGRYTAIVLQPPIEPMLAKLTTSIPDGDGWLYEPKWDGFRAIMFFDGSTVFLQSRDLKPLGRYFPEVVDGLRAALP